MKETTVPPSDPHVTAKLLLAVWVVWSSVHSCVPQEKAAQISNPFEDYFHSFAIAQGTGDAACEEVYSRIVDSIFTMKSTEIAAGVPIINRHLDDTAEPDGCLAKQKEAGMLTFISWRPDGADLLASQMDRFASMLNDPSHLLSTQAAMALQHIGYSRPTAVWPILEAALEAPDVNNKTGVGPGIAVVLLRMGPHGDDVTGHVAQYMRRADLTDNQLIDTITGINNGPVIPDILAAELVRCLDRANDSVKVRALEGIARSNPSAKDAARARVQRMSNDTKETTQIRRLAADALSVPITNNPDVIN